MTLNIKYKAVIFDFDDTLLGTSHLQPLFDSLKKTKRGSEKNRQLWKEILSNTKNLKQYDGMEEVFNFIKTNEIKAVIVTDAPKTRITPAIRHFEIPVIDAITRFDCERKPSPVPILKGLEKLGCSCDDVLSVGNQLVDLKATHAAGVKFAACEWGMQEEEREELYKQADYIIENPIDLLSLLK